MWKQKTEEVDKKIHYDTVYLFYNKLISLTIK